MLDFMRRNAASWGIKLLLGFISISFALFFGYTAYQGQSLGPQTAVIVGKEAVSLQQFNQVYDAALQNLRASADQETSPELERFLRSNVLEQIIQRSLRRHYADSLGFRVADSEVARLIQKQEQFYRDGVFDRTFYQERFRPYYQRQYGRDYEEALREDLLLDSFQSFLDTALLVSLEEKEWRQQTQAQKNGKSPASEDESRAPDETREQWEWVNLWLDEFREQIKIQKNPGL